jgi:nuclear pore complex protein Nup98-Nup96
LPSKYSSAFGQPQQQQQQQQTSIFGNTSTTGSTSLFGPTAFGAAAKPSFGGFGQPQQQQPSLFGQTQPQQQQPTSLFGQTTATPVQGLFGSNNPTSSFGQPVQQVQQNSGTAIAKFQPQQETDTLLKGSTTSYVQTKQQCITFMKEYAEKSLEELRIEDYAANRKGPQNATGTGLFGSNQTSNVFGQPAQTNTLFGQQSAQPTGLFGSTPQNTMGAPQNPSSFGASTSAFGQNTGGGLFGKSTGTATTSASFGGFGTNTSTAFGAVKPIFQSTAPTNTNLFGQTQPNTFGQPATSTFGTAAPFGQTNALFGATTSAPSFGLGTTSNTASTGFGGFAQTNQSTNLFGSAPKPTFGVSTGFGTSQAAPSANNNVFSGFGPSSSNLFAKPANAFGSFGQPAVQNTPIVSFGNTPGTSLFGSNTQTSAGTTGGLFGSTAPSGGGGLFGSTQPFGGTSNLSFGNTQPFNNSM